RIGRTRRPSGRAVGLTADAIGTPPDQPAPETAEADRKRMAPVNVTCRSEPDHAIQRGAGHVEVRRATHGDRAALFDFIRTAYPDRWQFKIPHRWEWQFEKNPFRQPGLLPVWIALDGKT